jgi:hypothetical protein
MVGAVSLRALPEHLRDAGTADPGIDAAVLLALIDGISLHYVVDPAGYPLDAATDRVIAVSRALTATQR